MLGVLSLVKRYVVNREKKLEFFYKIMRLRAREVLLPKWPCRRIKTLVLIFMAKNSICGHLKTQNLLKSGFRLKIVL